MAIVTWFALVLRLPTMFKQVDIPGWKRKEAFDFFLKFENPTYGFTVEIDITRNFHERKREKSLTAALVHLVTCGVNEVPEFKQRIVNGRVIEWDVIHPSYTVQGPNEQVCFTKSVFHPELHGFKASFLESIEVAKVRGTMFDKNQTMEDVFYLSIIPWIHFAAMTHPIKHSPPDSVPRMAIGKCVEHADGRVTVPLNIQVHHALIDAIHAARFFEAVQTLAK